VANKYYQSGNNHWSGGKSGERRMSWTKLMEQADEACDANNLLLARAKLIEALDYLDKYAPGSKDVMETLRPLTELMWRMGAECEAKPYLMRLLNTEEKLFGIGDIETATTLCRLSEVCFKEGAYADSEKFGRKHFVVKQRYYGDNHSEVHSAGRILAVLHQAAGNYEQAEVMYKRALNDLTKNYGAESAEVQFVLQNYASLLRLLHRDQEADHMVGCVSA
jgi:tetratricopeptide (TPR) repeat protein